MSRLRSGIRNAIYWALDAGETLAGRRDPLTPPRRLMNVGSNSVFRNDFNVIGQQIFGYLTRVGGLNNMDRVLDVGCGVGRMAIPLTRFLTGSGTYDGFDVVKPSIEFCQEKITPLFPKFHFLHADLFNTHYSPKGRIQPHEFAFPYPDQSFDFVFLSSVFTHMRHREVERYLAEIFRVMAPGARCFATFFLLNSETESLIERGAAAITFGHPVEHGRSLDAVSPDTAIAFDEANILALHSAAGLDIESAYYGSWRGAATEVGFQDIIVSMKPKLAKVAQA